MANNLGYLRANAGRIREELQRYPPIGPTKFDATILFGGKHTRFGGNKHLAEVHGHPPIYYTVRSLRKLESTGRIRALVGPPYQEEDVRYIESELKSYGVEPIVEEDNFWKSWNKVRAASLKDHGERLSKIGLEVKSSTETSKSDSEAIVSFDYFCRTAPMVEYFMGDSIYNVSGMQLNRALFVPDQIHDFSTEILPEYIDAVVGYSRRPVLHVMRTNQKSKRTIPTSSDPIIRKVGPIKVSIGFANWLHKPKNRKSRAIGISTFDSLPSRYDYDMIVAGNRYMDSIENFHMLVRDHHKFMRSIDTAVTMPHHLMHPNSYIIIKSLAGFVDIDTREDLATANRMSLNELLGRPLSDKEFAEARRLASWFRRKSNIQPRNMAAAVDKIRKGEVA